MIYWQININKVVAQDCTHLEGPNKSLIMGSIKDRNGTDLREAEDIKKRWQEYTTEEQYKKDFHDSDNYDGVTTHLEHSGL